MQLKTRETIRYKGKMSPLKIVIDEGEYLQQSIIWGMGPHKGLRLIMGLIKETHYNN